MTVTLLPALTIFVLRWFSPASLSIFLWVIHWSPSLGFEPGQNGNYVLNFGIVVEFLLHLNFYCVRIRITKVTVRCLSVIVLSVGLCLTNWSISHVLERNLASFNAKHFISPFWRLRVKSPLFSRQYPYPPILNLIINSGTWKLCMS